MNAIEIEVTDGEVEEFLNDLWGDVDICGKKYRSGTTLKIVNRIAFKQILATFPRKYQCSECETIYDNEDEAEDCCKDW